MEKVVSVWVRFKRNKKAKAVLTGKSKKDAKDLPFHVRSYRIQVVDRSGVDAKVRSYYFDYDSGTGMHGSEKTQKPHVLWPSDLGMLHPAEFAAMLLHAILPNFDRQGLNKVLHSDLGKKEYAVVYWIA